MEPNCTGCEKRLPKSQACKTVGIFSMNRNNLLNWNLIFHRFYKNNLFYMFSIKSFTFLRTARLVVILVITLGKLE